VVADGTNGVAYKLDRGRIPGTEPAIRVMGEADDQALVDALVSDVCDAVAGAA